MSGKAVVSGVIFVIMIAVLVSMVEFFLPLSAKADMNAFCRNTLLKVELEGCLPAPEKDNLHSRLTDKGFTNIVINNIGSVKRGEELNLRVEADYTYSKLTGIFTRTQVVQRMVYDKTTIARKVLN